MKTCKCKLCLGKSKGMFQKKWKIKINKNLKVDFGFKKD